ncbi:MAG: SDR family NAD(P)-dependent oxidoreductase [Xenococcaceae cyanobacterium MO_234.B1]|nr:SDR family NAD(P)-dependent oxidoreductase [Xenococcaceae cyanobacterium MO_234.B1]
MAELKGKVALVTGATRGVGKGIAIGLGEAGATVYITGRSLEQSNALNEVSGSLQETQLAVEEAGGKCIPVQVDHRDDEQVHLLFKRIQDEQKGQLDLLVNNVFSGVRAIRDAYGKPFWQSEPTLWDEINNVGLRSHYITSVFAARMMSDRQQGMICTISSWGGMSYIFGAAYGAGKAACDRLAADMASELKPDNIASISIWPGIVGTEHITNFANQMDESDAQTTFGDGYNWETPLLTGRVIAALASDPNIMKYTGKVQIVAELAEKYNLVDQNGDRPVSLRSLRFLIPFTFSALRKYVWLIPNIKVPWFLLLWGILKSPKI